MLRIALLAILVKLISGIYSKLTLLQNMENCSSVGVKVNSVNNFLIFFFKTFLPIGSFMDSYIFIIYYSASYLLSTNYWLYYGKIFK